MDLLLPAEAALIIGGRAVGQPLGRWIAPPSAQYPGQRPPRERRQGLVSVWAALTTYYGAALGFLLWHYGWARGWSQVEPYLRIHLFDGFGCAALFALIFRHIRQLHETPVQGSGLVRWFKSLRDERFLWAAAGFTIASAAIAAASVFVAGATGWDMLWAALLAAGILMGFWSGVVAGVALPVQPVQAAKRGLQGDEHDCCPVAGNVTERSERLRQMTPLPCPARALAFAVIRCLEDAAQMSDTVAYL